MEDKVLLKTPCNLIVVIECNRDRKWKIENQAYLLEKKPKAVFSLHVTPLQSGGCCFNVQQCANIQLL